MPTAQPRDVALSLFSPNSYFYSHPRPSGSITAFEHSSLRDLLRNPADHSPQRAFKKCTGMELSDSHPNIGDEFLWKIKNSSRVRDLGFLSQLARCDELKNRLDEEEVFFGGTLEVEVRGLGLAAGLSRQT